MLLSRRTFFSESALLAASTVPFTHFQTEAAPKPPRAGQRPTDEVILGPAGVREADHRIRVRARRTSVVYQARDCQGSAGVGHTPRRCAGPTASLRSARLGTMTTHGEQLACSNLGQPY